MHPFHGEGSLPRLRGNRLLYTPSTHEFCFDYEPKSGFGHGTQKSKFSTFTTWSLLFSLGYGSLTYILIIGNFKPRRERQNSSMFH